MNKQEKTVTGSHYAYPPPKFVNCADERLPRYKKHQVQLPQIEVGHLNQISGGSQQSSEENKTGGIGQNQPQHIVIKIGESSSVL